MSSVEFWTELTKTTKTAKPSIAVTQKLTSAEFNLLTDLINHNAQELIDLGVIVGNLPDTLPEVRKDVDFTITSRGIYLFFGSTQRTFTIADAIVGVVEIRTIATADLPLLGNINSNHLGTIFQGTPATVFRWDSVSGEYTF